MASNPYFSPYHTQRFSFIGSPQQRDGTFVKDQRFLNMYPELIKSPISDGKKYYLKKRPGTAFFQAFPAGTTQGIFFWNNTYITAVAGTVYYGSTAAITLSTTTGIVGFAEFRTDAIDELFICDGTSAWLLNNVGAATKITDVNFPSPHLPFPVFLDGYIFLASPGTQTIHNSKLQDPTTWPTDGFIDAEMFPDSLVGLTKSNNYIAAIGTMSVEWLYDNANATGSPLQRNAPAVSQFGCPAFATINQTEKQVIMVGSTSNGGRTVWTIEGFQPTEIAPEPVREALDLEGTNITAASAFTIQVSGHKFYVLNLVGSQRTFVYDFDEQMWHEWSSGSGQAAFSYRFAADSNTGVPVLLNYGGTVVQSVTLSASVFTDVIQPGATQPINCTVTTSKIDFDTIKRKRFYRLSLTTDAPNGDNDVPMLVQWSDDDYNTYNTGVTVQLDGDYPTITQLGYARRRVFKFTYTQPYPLRMESFEVDIIQEVRR